METLIIPLDCRAHGHNGRPQLGVRVETPRYQPTQGGLQITDIERGSVIDRDGRFKVGDIIVEVNGVNLERRDFDEAQLMLKEFVIEQSSHSILSLKVLRRSKQSSSSITSTNGSQVTVVEQNKRNNSSDNTPPAENSPKNSIISPSSKQPINKSNHGARHLVGVLNTRKLGAIHTIQLTKSELRGFGIKIAERDNKFSSSGPIYVTAITSPGPAYKDGRLKEGDMLLRINDIDLSGMSQSEVTRMLKGAKVGKPTKFVISRHHSDRDTNDDALLGDHNGCNNEKSLIDLDVSDPEDSVFDQSFSSNRIDDKVDNELRDQETDGPGLYTYDIPLNDKKIAGLGLALKYPKVDRKDLGVWIEQVITGGAAWKDGRLQRDDQILAINGIDLLGLSNVEASETLTAAISRGLGPEVNSGRIRLHIRRRDFSMVQKILQGSHNLIEHPCDNSNEDEVKTNLTMERLAINTQDCQQTPFDNQLNTKIYSLANDTSGNQNSQSDSAMSPQTQASNSPRLSNSCNDKSEHNSIDKTNDTSSAISQITDFTTVAMPEESSIDVGAATLPKTLNVSCMTHDFDSAPSVQSWDDESVDNENPGDDPFQRDGFGRQSISEKRHAQLMAKNTDTFKRNQKLRDERERERQMIAQLEQQHISDYNTNQNEILSRPREHPMSVFPDDRSHSMYVQNNHISNNVDSEYLPVGHHREVPVDVRLLNEAGVDVERPYDWSNPATQFNYFTDLLVKPAPQAYGYDQPPHIMVPTMQYGTSAANQGPMDRCWKCGSSGAYPCARYGYNDLNIRGNLMDSQLVYPHHTIGRLNGMRQAHTYQSTLLDDEDGSNFPRANTMRLIRGRNESFRVAVDRSYEANAHTQVREQNQIPNGQQRLNSGAKAASSIANSTTSTSNDERYLLSYKSNNMTNQTHKKSSSLISKFLKFGSMKKSKKKGKDSDGKIMRNQSSRLTS